MSIMSEYQYYEFRTDGKTLDETARKELRQLSSRAIVTSTQAIYTYSYNPSSEFFAVNM